MEHHQSSGSDEKSSTTTTVKTRLIRSLSGLENAEKKAKKKERRKSGTQQANTTDEDIFANVEEGGDYEILMKTLGSNDDSGSLPQKPRRSSFTTPSPDTAAPLVRRDSGRGQTVEMYAKLSKECEALRWDHASIIGRICKIELDVGKMRKATEIEEKPTRSCCSCLW